MKNKNFLPNRKDIKRNLRKTNGWKNYKEMTEDNDKLHMAATMKNKNPEKILKVMEKEINKVKHKSFGKVKIG